MTDEQTALLADVERTLTEQLVNWVRRETRQAFAALAVEMERAARQGGSGGYRGSSDNQSLTREE